MPAIYPKPLKGNPYLYLLPYLLFILYGIYLRYSCGSFPFLYPDSNSYLLPAVFKKVTGNWYLGDRPVQYLQLLYFSLFTGNHLKTIVTLQQCAGIAGAVVLVLTWLRFIKTLQGPELPYHIIGWVATAVYATSPLLLFYEKLIEPEAIAIFLMCLVIYGIVIAADKNTGAVKRIACLSALILINFYLSKIMTKWMFAGMFLQLAFVIAILKSKAINTTLKATAIAVPLVAYYLLIILPGKNAVEQGKRYDRFYVELNQMVYTHFNLLIQDKNNFKLPAALLDSLEVLYLQSCNNNRATLSGFANDDLMAGPANALITAHFNQNYDSLQPYFINLNYTLVTRYPLQLTGNIAKQFAAFYIPNKYIHKEAYPALDLCTSYRNSVETANDFDGWIKKLPGEYKDKVLTEQQLAGYYMADSFERQTQTVCSDSPKLLSGLPGFNWLFNTYFDYLFIAVLLALLLQAAITKTIYMPLVGYHIAIAIYAGTIAIVHTFDVQRFISTIYPFLITMCFMGLAWLVHSIIQHKQRHA